MSHLNASAIDPMAMYVSIFQGLCIQARKQGNRAVLTFLGQYLTSIMDDDALDAFRDQLRQIQPDGSPPGYNALLELIGDQEANEVQARAPEPPAPPPPPPPAAPTPAAPSPSRIPAPMW